MIYYKCKGRRKNMSKILLLEDDFSLITGLTFALQKQAMN